MILTIDLAVEIVTDEETCDTCAHLTSEGHNCDNCKVIITAKYDEGVVYDVVIERTRYQREGTV